MTMSQVLLGCLCFLGTAQIASSQTRQAGIPGFYNPTTGKFTTQVAPSTKTQSSSSASGASVFFREQFNITITNYDQPSTNQAVCSVSMSGGDAGGTYEESASVIATPDGSGWTCIVPVLTLWTLQTPTADTIYASVTVDIYPQGATSPNNIFSALRESIQSLSVPQPGNTQTAYNDVSFQL